MRRWHALVAAVWRARVPLRDVRPEVRTLLAEPTLHLFQTKVGRGMHGEEHTARGPARRRRLLRESLAFTNHTVFEVTDLKDTVPGSITVLAELNDLGAKEVTVDESCARGKEHLGEVNGRHRDARGTTTHPQLIRRVCALQVPPSAPRILPVWVLQLPSHRTLLKVVERLARAPEVAHPG